MKPKIIAHRGYSKKFPENTLLSFRKAIELGADGFECDLRFSKDKKIIIHHFAELGKTDSGSGYAYDKDLEYLQSLDCGSWFSPEFKDEKMPTLEDIFEEFGESINYEIEIKDYGREFADAVLQRVRDSNLLSKIELTSFQYPILSYIKKQESLVRVGLITQQIPEWMTNRQAQELMKSNLIEGIIDVIHFPVDLFDQELVNEVRTMNVKIHAGLCNTEEQLVKARELNVDLLNSDDVALALSVVNK